MSFLRFGRRNIEENARLHIEGRLQTLGWTDPTITARPFNAPGATTVVTRFLALDGSRPIAAGTTSPIVSVSVPGDSHDTDLEIGGPLAETSYDLFVSVIAVPALVHVLTEDIVDLLAGRTDRPVIQPFKEISTGVEPIPGELLDLQDVSSGPARLDRDDWMLITATIVRTFSRNWTP